MNNAMQGRERPILFSGPMVRAILDGRKTQTRRVVTDQTLLVDLAHPNAHDIQVVEGGIRFHWLPAGPPPAKCRIASVPVRLPYGLPGDRLWVRETWQRFRSATARRTGVRYAADNAFAWIGDKEALHDHRWRPSIHMPRWASRLMLAVTEVRVERLNDISEADAIAEGYESRDAFLSGDFASPLRSLNPWLWCIAFSVFRPAPPSGEVPSSVTSKNK